MIDANAKVGQETIHQPTIGKHSLHESTNENGHRLVDFAAGRQNQIDLCLIDGRHFSDVIDFMARRGENIDSDHMLVIIKLRARTCRANNTKPQQLRRFAVDRLKDGEVALRYYD
jgi:hypothetical protein